jgi:glycerate dehydrogenase
VQKHASSIAAGEWETKPQFCYWLSPIVELDGKTLGLVGFGNTGIRTAQIANALGMKVLVYTRTKKPEYENDNLKFVTLDELLAQSDVISLHCPLNAQTDKMINAAAIQKMKDGALLLNTARGGLLDEQAVADALNSGKLGGAALDVLSIEPPVNNPLVGAKNCILTPHIAWASIEARSRLMDVVVQNAKAFMDGTPQNVVK